MCGIAGYINYDFSNPYFQKVNDLQVHRGPDYQDLYIHENVQLYHQRLSIIDVSAKANQPFIKGDLIIVFNGEIYNYKAIRKSLENDHGIHFRTSSDTEVLLELFRLKKHKCLDELRGMFAFAIYDIRSKELFLARDPFGIKPLFLHKNGEKFAFASELKTLVNLPDLSKDINLASLVNVINYVWLPGNDTMFSQIKKLPAAAYAILNSQNELSINRYYQPPKISDEYSLEDAVEMLDARLKRSVEAHLEADVPVSSFLSGGLDSSLLAVLANQYQPVSTYSIAFRTEDKRIEQMPDDARYARQVAESHGFDHNEILINPSITDELPKMVYHLDEPIGDPSAINTYLISKAARDRGIKVLLSGMGADEIFFGYRRQKATLYALRYQSMPLGARRLINQVAKTLPVRIGKTGLKPTRWAKRFLSFADLPPSDAYLRSYSYYDKSAYNNLFEKDVSTEVNDLYQAHTALFEDAFEADVINKMCYTDLHYFMPGLNLTVTDRASMAASVEVRVPFIDKEIVNLALSIKGDFKFYKGKQKYILKKVAEKYLPHNIVYRPKASFSVPIRSWISGDMKAMVGDILNQDSVRRRGIFNADFIQKLINDDKTGKVDNAYQIYQLLTTELWFREFID